MLCSSSNDASLGRVPSGQALWASAALELLSKAALARVSPLLIAGLTGIRARIDDLRRVCLDADN
jgi:hypothetical protein